MASRNPTAKNRRKRGSNTWKDIDQSVRPKSRSAAAGRRLWMGRLKLAAGLAGVFVVVAAALHFVPKVEGGPELLTKAGEKLPIRSVDVHTDGTLSEAFVLERLAIEENANLLSVDLDAMKARLEAIGQVAEAVVSRRFPDALEVTIAERRPIARIKAQRPNREVIVLYVDRQGEVFEAEALDPKQVRSLPFLGGVELYRKGEGFSRIEGIEPLAKLLEETQAIAPHLGRYMGVFSLAREDRLIAKGRAPKEIIFDCNGDFRQQLGKLDYILDYYRSTRSGAVESVDLTLGDQVPVRAL